MLLQLKLIYDYIESRTSYHSIVYKKFGNKKFSVKWNTLNSALMKRKIIDEEFVEKFNIDLPTYEDFHACFDDITKASNC